MNKPPSHARSNPSERTHKQWCIKNLQFFLLSITAEFFQERTESILFDNTGYQVPELLKSLINFVQLHKKNEFITNWNSQDNNEEKVKP